MLAKLLIILFAFCPLTFLLGALLALRAAQSRRALRRLARETRRPRPRVIRCLRESPRPPVSRPRSSV